MNASLVTSVLSKALDGLYARQTAIADNVANAQSGRAAVYRVNFEDELNSAMLSAGSEIDRARRVKAIKPDARLVPLLENDFRLDLEVMESGSTSSRFQQIATVLDKQIQLMHLALTDTKR